MNMWFDPQVGNMLGAILGSSIGVLGGIWGTLVGIFARKGKYRKVLLPAAIGLIIIGVTSLVIALAALFYQQPKHVILPFAIIGFVLSASILPNYFNVKKVYLSAELKKMAADDMK